MSEPTFSLDTIFKLGEIASFIVGAAIIAYRGGRSSSRFEEAVKNLAVLIEQQAKTLEAVQADIRDLNKVVTTVAVQGTRLDLMSQRIDLLDRRYEELRHGDGFTLPMRKSPYEVG